MEGLAEIIIAKHRNGAVTDVKLRFLKDQAKFTNWDNIATTGGGVQYEEIASGDFGAAPSALQSATNDEFAPF